MNNEVFELLVKTKKDLMEKEEKIKELFNAENSFISYAIDNIVNSIYITLADKYILPEEIPDVIFEMLLYSNEPEGILETFNELFEYE